jgi:hypothetical protein
MILFNISISWKFNLTDKALREQTEKKEKKKLKYTTFTSNLRTNWWQEKNCNDIKAKEKKRSAFDIRQDDREPNFFFRAPSGCELSIAAMWWQRLWSPGFLLFSFLSAKNVFSIMLNNRDKFEYSKDVSFSFYKREGKESFAYSSFGEKAAAKNRRERKKNNKTIFI